MDYYFDSIDSLLDGDGFNSPTLTDEFNAPILSPYSPISPYTEAFPGDENGNCNRILNDTGFLNFDEFSDPVPYPVELGNMLTSQVTSYVDSEQEKKNSKKKIRPSVKPVFPGSQFPHPVFDFGEKPVYEENQLEFFQDACESSFYQEEIVVSHSVVVEPAKESFVSVHKSNRPELIKKKKRKAPKKKKAMKIEEEMEEEEVFRVPQRAPKRKRGADDGGDSWEPKLKRQKTTEVVISVKRKKSSIEVMPESKEKLGAVVHWSYAGTKMDAGRGGSRLTMLPFGTKVKNLGNKLVKLEVGQTMYSVLENGKLGRFVSPRKKSGFDVFFNPEFSNDVLVGRGSGNGKKQLGLLSTLDPRDNSVVLADAEQYGRNGSKAGDVRIGVDPRKGYCVTADGVFVSWRLCVGLRKFKRDNGIELDQKVVFRTPFKVSLIELGYNQDVDTWWRKRIGHKETACVDCAYHWRQSTNNPNNAKEKVKVKEVRIPCFVHGE